MRRLLDILASVAGLILLSPVLIVICLIIWLRDFHNPFYVAQRVGRGGREFRMLKLRSMVADADRIGGSSSGVDDSRITWIGRHIRRFKLDEFGQLWNVLKGDMSLVGPRPQIAWAVKEYTSVERRLLEARPGITDPASIIFSDQDSILTGAEDPDLLYSQIIRPWKNRLALLYVDQGCVLSYCEIVLATLAGMASRRISLAWANSIVARLGADTELLRVSRRDEPPPAAPPPGASVLVTRIERT